MFVKVTRVRASSSATIPRAGGEQTRRRSRRLVFYGTLHKVVTWHVGIANYQLASSFEEAFSPSNQHICYSGMHRYVSQHLSELRLKFPESDIHIEPLDQRLVLITNQVVVLETGPIVQYEIDDFAIVRTLNSTYEVRQWPVSAK